MRELTAMQKAPAPSRRLPMLARISGVLTAIIMCCLCATAQRMHTLKIKDEKELRSFFSYTGKDIPLISGHRGCHIKGFPENSIAAFKNTLEQTPAFFEIDPRLTKDSVIVLLHDDTLDRTTTGTGKLADYTWEQVKQLKLKDSEGNITQYGVPTLVEAIQWAKGKTILNLDKKDVPFKMIADIIRKQNAGAWVMLTVHTAEQAKFYYDDDHNRMFSAFVKTRQALEEYDKAGIPTANMIAYIGSVNTPDNKALIDLLHKRGIMCMISAAPVYDKLSDSTARAAAYHQTFEMNADILESDLPAEVATAIKPLTVIKSTKQRFFLYR
jgi:glycerophosphoryl diester phosphodiesterase